MFHQVKEDVKEIFKNSLFLGESEIENSTKYIAYENKEDYVVLIYDKSGIATTKGRIKENTFEKKMKRQMKRDLYKEEIKNPAKKQEDKTEAT